MSDSGSAWPPRHRTLIEWLRDTAPEKFSCGHSEDGTLLFELAGHVGAVQGGAFDRASERVITVGSGGSSRVWSTATGKLLLRLPSPGLGTSSAAFDATGARIATGSYGGLIHLWDAATGRRLETLTGHRRPVLDVAFSPDGRRLASTSNDETARIWSTENQRLLCTFVLSEPGEWLAITPAQRFIGIPAGLQQQVAEDLHELLAELEVLGPRALPAGVVEAHGGQPFCGVSVALKRRATRRNSSCPSDPLLSRCG